MNLDRFSEKMRWEDDPPGNNFCPDCGAWFMDCVCKVVIDDEMLEVQENNAA